MIHNHSFLVLQKLDDTNPQVREAAMECLGTLLRVVGDRPMGAYIENIDKTKMAKVCTLRHSELEYNIIACIILSV